MGNLFAVETPSSRITCLTSKCHSGMGDAQFLPSPIKAKGCVACHQLVDPGMIKGNKKTDINHNKKLPKDHPNIASNMGKNQSAICLKCHVEWGRTFEGKKHPHPAIKEKGCTACHNPHGSDNAKLLKNKEFNQPLCLTCHKKNENWEKGDKDNLHRGMNVKNKCLNCHEIHSSKEAKLLQAPPVALCAKCHEEITSMIETSKTKGSMHTPAKKGECLKCHSPHYSEMENMLSKSYDVDGYVKNVEKSFKLCMSCHKPLETTQFRNGEINLHALHGNFKDKEIEKFIGCAVCHDTHGSTQEMQIRKDFSYKKTKYKITYLKEINGGNCTTSCHTPKNYDRINPIVYPPPVVEPIPAIAPGTTPAADTTATPKVGN